MARALKIAGNKIEDLKSQIFQRKNEPRGRKPWRDKQESMPGRCLKNRRIEEYARDNRYRNRFNGSWLRISDIRSHENKRRGETIMEITVNDALNLKELGMCIVIEDGKVSVEVEER